MKKEKKSKKLILNKKDVLGFIVVRLVIVTAIIISAVSVQFSTSTFLPLAQFYSLIIFMYILSAIYFGLYVWGKFLFYQVYLQIFSDLLIITALVYISGGLENSFYFLYVFEIIAASIILSNRAAYITAALSAVCFGFLVDGMFLGLIPYFGDIPNQSATQGEVLSNLFTAWSVFFIVAFLINYLVGKLRHTKSQLLLAQRELDASRRFAVAGEVSALMSHEIRNPLAAISGSVQVLRGELDLSEEQKKLMDIVVNESTRVSKTLNQYLSLTVNREKDFAEIDLSEVCKETLLLMKNSGEINGGCDVNGNFRSISCFYYGNKDQFKQVFWNLINNAIKSMQGVGTLTIDFSRLANSWTELRFRDAGQGMTEEVQQRIFEPFYSNFHRGKGIGMSVVKRIVDDYTGKIEIHSDLNKGTEIVIALPSKKQKSQPQFIVGDD
ncbi:MAG: ATP-binding protein [Candidatus Aminicenantes bacterium]|nr:ATP-binding protein [Candidatus Aminicenantes bacterium]